MVTVIACAFFAAICGSSPATVAAIGAIMIPAMINRGYSIADSAAVSACAGGLGIIIPPSVNMVIYGVTAGVSISDMFMAGFLPGFLIVIVLCLLNYFIAKKKRIAKSGVKFSFRGLLHSAWDAKWALLAPVLPLPMADAVIDDGERLPATYANFLIMNDAVLYPTYNQPTNDRRAAEVLQEAFPGYEIVGIDCQALIRQHGSLHCVTMQYPEGVIK